MIDQAHLPTHRSPVRDLVARHPLMVFFVLAYAISWTGWILSGIDLGVVNGFGILGTLGPALAAMLVTGFLRPEPSGIPAARRWVLFGITALLALGIMVARRIWVTPEWMAVAGPVKAVPEYPSSLAIGMDLLAAGLVGFVLSGVYSSRQGVQALLYSFDLRRKPVGWPWWLVAAGLYPAIVALGSAISAAAGLQELSPKTSAPAHLLVLDVLLTGLLYIFHGGGLEEPGWRGFALPLLQKRFSPLRASLFLAIAWAAWHAPLIPGGLVGLGAYLLVVVAPLTILFTAVYNRTSGSLPVVILLHISINLTAVYLPESSLSTVLWLLLAIGLAVWMWRSPQKFAAPEVGWD